MNVSVKIVSYKDVGTKDHPYYHISAYGEGSIGAQKRLIRAYLVGRGYAKELYWKRCPASNRPYVEVQF